jgi:hypothetical protein
LEGANLPSAQPSKNRFERSRGRVVGGAKEGIDDWDKASSFVGTATARHSTSSLVAKIDRS